MLQEKVEIRKKPFFVASERDNNRHTYSQYTWVSQVDKQTQHHPGSFIIQCNNSTYDDI